MHVKKMLFLVSVVFCGLSRASANKCLPNFIFKKEELSLSQSVNISKLTELTQWPLQEKLPIYSIIISKQGKVFYEMYTSNIKENEIHPMYSVTKSVVSLLVGIAKDQGYIKNVNDPITRIFHLDKTENFSVKKFSSVSLKDTMAMSAIASEEFPISKSYQAQNNSTKHFMSSDRFKHALSEPLLSHIGKDFNYSENTMALIGGGLQSLTGKNLSTYASQNLFDKLGFKDYRWMYRDISGGDMAGYGLKIRPLDLHKIGLLVMNKGCWEGEQIISEEWIDQIQKPWIKSSPNINTFDYGWLWWSYTFPNNWNAFVARGKGEQLLIVFPKKEVVVTMTAHIEQGQSREQIITKFITKYIIPTFEAETYKNSPDDLISLQKSLKEVLLSSKNFRGLSEPENEPSNP